MNYMSSCSQVSLLGKEFSDLLRQDNFNYSVKKKKKSVFFRSPLYFFVKNKRLDKRHMRKKWGHISFEVQKQCVLKVMLEAVIVAACVSPQMKPECRGVSIKNCLQSPSH